MVKDEGGKPLTGDFGCSSVVGILLYFSGGFFTDIFYAVNCVDRYILYPKHSHEFQLNRIGQYLKATRDRCLVLNPSTELNIDCYHDTGFSVMYGHENATDTACVKRRTGYKITVSDFPVVCKSKLQTGTAILHMEVKIISISYICRELIPKTDMVDILGKSVGIHFMDAKINLSMLKDNSGALVLVEPLTPQFTPRSKNYATKTIWFLEKIFKEGIKPINIGTI